MNTVSAISEAVVALALLVFISFMSIMAMPPATSAASLTLDMGPSGITYSSVSLSVMVYDAPNDVEAFGLEICFDPNILEFERLEQGELAAQFDMFEASTPESGVVRVAGIAPSEGTGINEGESGELARLTFAVIAPCAASNLSLCTLIDGVEDWDTENGTLDTPPSCEFFDDPIVFGEDSGYGLCFVETLL
ncbi:MAG: cohesin domain-containing protein [bacterium]